THTGVMVRIHETNLSDSAILPLPIERPYDVGMGRMRTSTTGVMGKLTGVAAAYAHVKRLTASEALAEVRDVLAGLRPTQRQELLDEAAAMYVAPDENHRWYSNALELLVSAGANRDTAEQIRARQSGLDLGKIGEQAARLAPPR